MNFELSEEQQLLQDSVARFVADHYSLDARRKLADSSQGYSDDHWKQFAELGWLALPFSEEDGGLGGTVIDALVVMEQFGKGLILEPYFATVILGGGVLKRLSASEIRSARISAVMEGQLKLALATTELQSRWDLHDVVSTATPDGEGFVLNGSKSVVLHGASADGIIVSLRTQGGQFDKEGISLFWIDPKADGVSLKAYPTVDGLRAAELTLEKVSVPSDALLGPLHGGFDILDAVAQEATLALSAEGLGAMERLYKDTVEYTQNREQFDHPLSDFQTLQHRMVEMFMEYEQCKSLLYRATLEFAQDGMAASKSVSACKHLVGVAGRFIGENAVQLHGGMGVTEELAIGHYFKRLFVIDTQFGNADYHLERYAA
ncbi:MAG: acyl-CoA dehydrogenase family protein [Pseudomonadota bacterium]|nr:acyl-CoA dehydrogenase family protein [Pseudomonadota bacterium]